MSDPGQFEFDQLRELIERVGAGGGPPDEDELIRLVHEAAASALRRSHRILPPRTAELDEVADGYLHAFELGRELGRRLGTPARQAPVSQWGRAGQRQPGQPPSWGDQEPASGPGPRPGASYRPGVPVAAASEEQDDRDQGPPFAPVPGGRPAAPFGTAPPPGQPQAPEPEQRPRFGTGAPPAPVPGAPPSMARPPGTPPSPVGPGVPAPAAAQGGPPAPGQPGGVPFGPGAPGSAATPPGQGAAPGASPFGPGVPSVPAASGQAGDARGGAPFGSGAPGPGQPGPSPFGPGVPAPGAPSPAAPGASPYGPGVPAPGQHEAPPPASPYAPGAPVSGERPPQASPPGASPFGPGVPGPGQQEPPRVARPAGSPFGPGVPAPAPPPRQNGNGRPKPSDLPQRRVGVGGLAGLSGLMPSSLLDTAPPDERLPIFEAARSDWFAQGRPATPPPAPAEPPPVAPPTRAGLPQRVPLASLAPDLPRLPPPRGHGADAPSRAPSEIGGLLSRYRRGLEQGRYESSERE